MQIVKAQGTNMHARFVKTFKLSRPLHPFMSVSHRTKRKKGCSKLMKTRKDNRRSSSQDYPKLMKRRKSKENSFPTIFSLPHELITEILARVAANSSDDFFNVKLSCKVFNQIADDKHVLQHVSLEKFDSWFSSTKHAFLEKCKSSGNPEALFRNGVVAYFNFYFARVREGLNYLSSAAKVGHLGASYVLGVILLCTQELDQEQEGRHLLKYVKSKKRTKESRKKFNEITNRIWRNNLLVPKPNYCPMQNQHKPRQGWPTDEEDDVDCEACACDLEVNFVCNLLRGIWTY